MLFRVQSHRRAALFGWHICQWTDHVRPIAGQQLEAKVSLDHSSITDGRDGTLELLPGVAGAGHYRVGILTRRPTACETPRVTGVGHSSAGIFARRLTGTIREDPPTYAQRTCRRIKHCGGRQLPMERSAKKPE